MFDLLRSLPHTGTDGKRHNKSERKQGGVHPGAHFMVHRVEAQCANTDEEEDNARHAVSTLSFADFMESTPASLRSMRV